ncbi:MAG: alpha/beta hydrolase family protein, partial [Planctomycetota bacterium]
VPEDHRPGVRLPLIFFMHGAGGKPTSWPWKSATGGKGYLICGLSYGAFGDSGGGGIPGDKKSALSMVAFVDKVRDLIDKTYGIDQESVFLSGLSMGGWGVNFYGFLDEARGKYRGYCIMAAGLRRGAAVDLSVTDGLPVLLINGETDANLPAANAGKPAFEKAGAMVTQVVLPGEGHVPSTAAMAPPLGKWLRDIAAADEKKRALVAISWQPGQLAGSSEDEPSRKAALQNFLKKQDFLKGAENGKPVLLFCYSRRTGKKDRPTRAARSSTELEETIFSYPCACAVPAASRYFACFKVDVSLVDERTDPRLHEGTAPAVILMDRNHTLVQAYKKSKLRDANLSTEMKKLLTEEEQQSVDERVAATRPLLKEMQALQKRWAALQKTITRLKKSPHRRSKKRLEAKLADRAELEKRYEVLREKLLK